ncbi:hypothetical protein JAO76_11805 [Pontibacter sp. BT310]|uniref:Uncharacterized protein n=1 Tax=Pontibacter populi TaxID=890055 RepID=A0ABS6XCK4_9BACT|nr:MULTISPECIES: hypothetical protein [Pontibacter]MBJ6118883.1 hypothetical protein [Pontibacter sp. BT310]MBR0571311.1 hypothetical protein [Microvirga sp. STS03]MBW3365737.1 hypothetical protein [Pontibacter populi]
MPSIVFKATESGSKEKISSDGLSRIVFPQKDGEPALYESVYLKTITGKKSKEPAWLQKLMDGPATLYCGGARMSFQQGSFTHNVTDISFYAIRANEEAASSLSVYFTSGAVGININNTFRKLASAYFADYPELVKRIEAKEFKYLRSSQPTTTGKQAKINFHASTGLSPVLLFIYATKPFA